MSAICRSLISSSRVCFPKERLSVDLTCYVIANFPSFSDKQLYFSRCKQAAKAGAKCLQYRDHKSNFLTILKNVVHLKNILKEFDTHLIINTPHLIEIAKAVDAEGVYLEEPLSPAEVREALGQRVTIGIPIKTANEALAFGQSHAVDYFSVKIGKSNRTCDKNDNIVSLEEALKISGVARHPILTVGGHAADSVASAFEKFPHDSGVALAGGVLDQDDPYATVRKILSIAERIRGKV